MIFCKTFNSPSNHLMNVSAKTSSIIISALCSLSRRLTFQNWVAPQPRDFLESEGFFNQSAQSARFEKIKLLIIGIS